MAKLNKEAQAIVDELTAELIEAHDLLQWLEGQWIKVADKVTKVTRMAQALEFVMKEPLTKKAICERISNKYEPISMGSLGSQLSYLKDQSRSDGGHVWFKDDLGRYVYQGCIFDAGWDNTLRRTVKSSDKVHEAPVAAKTILRKKA